MAVVVDPGRLDPHHRGDERGEEQRFEIEAVEHGAELSGFGGFPQDCRPGATGAHGL
jgi:hypothetical protein